MSRASGKPSASRAVTWLGRWKSVRQLPIPRCGLRRTAQALPPQRPRCRLPFPHSFQLLNDRSRSCCDRCLPKSKLPNGDSDDDEALRCGCEGGGSESGGCCCGCSCPALASAAVADAGAGVNGGGDAWSGRL